MIILRVLVDKQLGHGFAPPMIVTLFTMFIGNGDWYHTHTDYRHAGLCPSLHYHLPSDISARSALRFLKGQKNRDESEELEQFDIREVKDLDRKNYISYTTNW